MKRHNSPVGHVGLDLVEVDDLIAELWRVRTRTDDYENDVQLAGTLCDEGADIALLLRTVGEDCAELARTVQRRADDLRAFRLERRRLSTRALEANYLEADAVGDAHRRALIDQRRLGFYGRRPTRVDKSLVSVAAGRSAPDLTDPDGFDDALAQRYVHGYGGLVLALEAIRLSDASPGVDPAGAASYVIGGSGRAAVTSDRVLTEFDLRLIVESDLAQYFPGAVDLAAELLAKPSLLIALDEAAERKGDLFADDVIRSDDGKFSLNDGLKLITQRELAIGLTPHLDDIDSIVSGVVDGKIKSKDLERFIEKVSASDPEAAMLAELALDLDYYERTPWQKTADWSAEAGKWLTIVTFAVGVGYLSSGAAIPFLVSALATGGEAALSALEITAGVVTGEDEHIISGLLGLFALGVGVGIENGGQGLKSLAGMSDEQVRIAKQAETSLEFLGAGHKVPIHSLSEAHNFGLFPPARIDSIVAASGGVRAYPGADYELSTELTALTLRSAHAPPIDTVWNVGRYLRISRTADLAIHVLKGAGSRDARTLAHRFLGGQPEPGRTPAVDEESRSDRTSKDTDATVGG